MSAGVRTRTYPEPLDAMVVAGHSRQGQEAGVWGATQLSADQPSLSLHSLPHVCGVKRLWLARPTVCNRRTQEAEEEDYVSR